MPLAQTTHRPSALKQANKSHKHGKHKSKGELEKLSKGKISVKTISKRVHKETRDDRRNKSQQLRQNKRDELLAKKRLLGRLDSAPFLVCVLPLHTQVDYEALLSSLFKCDSEAVIKTSETGIRHLSLLRFKQRYSFIIPRLDNNLEVLDCLKVCDTVLLVISANDSDDAIDQWADLNRAAFAQGFPTLCAVLTDLEYVNPKKVIKIKQHIQKEISKWFPDERVMYFEKETDCLNILRKIGDQKQKIVLYRDRRPHILAETYEYVKDEQGTMGTLKLSGYLRGTTLSVNSLVHLPGLGDFQMSQIDLPDDPNFLEKQRKLPESTTEPSDKITVKVIGKADPEKQESLISENVPDPMNAEQTWPTEEELKMAAQEEKQSKKIIKKVPAGWSAYQASWIPDVDAETISESEKDDDLDDDMSFSEAASEEKSEVSDDDYQTVTESEIGVPDDQYDQQIDIRDEINELEKIKNARLDKMFPDEIDTPQNVAARERFQKYRGLESFRTTPWDPKESLPSDYARIFQFQNFNHTKKRMLKQEEEKEGASPGCYITVHVKAVSEQLWSNFIQTKSPLILIGLFPHEHKMSVLNAVLKRTPDYEMPIESKARLIIQCGYRRFIVNPIFSQHTNGNKHKYERFFQPQSTAVATFFAPIQFPPAPVLCFKEIDNELILVATGSLMSVNPDRIILKRIVLSGFPLKINKKSVVVRFMFFNRDDINYFKPCKIHTKCGRMGHIKEPLGTHGHMKCIFNGPLTSQDTVLLNLYKRVFPKWHYEECIVSCSNDTPMEE